MNFTDPSLVAIFPCAHACCISCLVQRKKKADASQLEEDENDKFDSNNCPLCREEWSPVYLDDIAQSIVKESIIPSFGILASKLPFPKEERPKLIVSLLEKNDFYINKVENALFNLIGMVENNIELNSDAKQEYFKGKFIFLYKTS